MSKLNLGTHGNGHKTGPFLSEAQRNELRPELVHARLTSPVRFMYRGQNLNISNGELLPKGTNIIHQHHYYSFTPEVAKKIATMLGPEVSYQFTKG